MLRDELKSPDWSAPPARARVPARLARAVLYPLGSLVLLLAVVVLGVGVGSSAVSPLETLTALWHGLSGQVVGSAEVIVWELRLPRVVMGLLVGASLAMSGAASQALFRNPLADPYLLGAASGGVLGATLALLLDWPRHWVPPVTFVFSCASVVLTLLLGRQGRSFPPMRLLLSGTVVGSLVTALSTYALLSQGDRVREVYAWTLGNLAFSGWESSLRVLPYALCGGLMLWGLARALNTLGLGEATAHSLGIPVERLRVLTILASTLTTAAAVSFVGIIGFVGLVAPHIVRRLFGSDLRLTLPLCAVAGAVLLSLSDTLARVVLAPQELPIGIVTTLLGGPFFLWLLRKQA